MNDSLFPEAADVAVKTVPSVAGNGGANDAAVAKPKRSRKRKVDAEAVDITPENGAEIKRFLISCTPFMADAMRTVLHIIADNAGDFIDITKLNRADIAQINRFLNYSESANAGTAKDAQTVATNRQNQARMLLNALNKLVDKDEIVSVSSLLMGIIADAKFISDAVNNSIRK